MNHDLDAAFDIEVIEPDTVDGRLPAIRHSVENVEENVDDDYAKTRQNLHNLLEQSTEALAKAFQVAISSEHPTAFESATMLAKTVADINAQLLELSEKRLKLRQASGKGGDGEGKTVNNAIFVGTAAELQKMLKGE